jgi:hypothetical protein
MGTVLSIIGKYAMINNQEAIMKKISAVLIAIAIVSGLTSCKSMKPSVDKAPTVNDAFQQVFNYYRDDLNLEGATAYIVQPGDTLTGVSKTIWGGDKGYYFPVIMLASSQAAVINDPDVIEPGMQLIIPNLEKNLADAKARAAIKSYLKDVSDIYARKYAKSNKAEDNRTTHELSNLSDSL